MFVHVCVCVLLLSRNSRVLQFTGSGRVAEHLSEITRGKVKIEDAGFDWKILGPDVQVWNWKRDLIPPPRLDASAKLLLSSSSLFSPCMSSLQEVDYVAQTCDGDAYNCSGQKCSAQSILFMHENWEKESNLLKQMEELAARRSIQDLTIGPVLTW